MNTINLKLTLILILCIFSDSLSAQTIEKLGQHKIDDHIYTVSKYGHEGKFSVQENLTVISRVRKKSKNLTNIEFASFSSGETLNSAFIKVLGRDRIRELVPEGAVFLRLYFNTDGKILSVEFVLNKKSELTLKEINRLTIFIKNNVSFKIPSYVEKKSKLCTPLTQVIHFNKLLYM
ncbi:MAG TPA: hypothetical protein VK084_11345 [Chitinophagaceae bacterium]|nr:hypothetical protein [Chitinophagaceae bacterium]